MDLKIEVGDIVRILNCDYAQHTGNVSKVGLVYSEYRGDGFEIEINDTTFHFYPDELIVLDSKVLKALYGDFE